MSNASCEKCGAIEPWDNESLWICDCPTITRNIDEVLKDIEENNKS